jgi:hypothetical protein
VEDWGEKWEWELGINKDGWRFFYGGEFIF